MNKIEIKNDVALVNLNNKQVAIVDVKDVPLIQDYKWTVNTNRKKRI